MEWERTEWKPGDSIFRTPPPGIIWVDQNNNFIQSSSPMNENISQIAGQFLDAKLITLINAGFLSPDLRLTSRGMEALDAILAQENMDAFVAAAQAALDKRTKQS